MKFAALIVPFLFVTPALADHISLGCTPIPQVNAEPDRNPSVRINVDFEIHPGQATPDFAVYHMLADGAHADRWEQYDFTGFAYWPPDRHTSAARYLFQGSRRTNPNQSIIMELWAPMPDAVDQAWYYQEYIGRTGHINLGGKPVTTARCYQEGRHREWGPGGVL